jgi:hypothetical protein
MYGMGPENLASKIATALGHNRVPTREMGQEYQQLLFKLYPIMERWMQRKRSEAVNNVRPSAAPRSPGSISCGHHSVRNSE